MSTFSGLNTALTSLLAQRQALEVAGQNIANVNTPGYTRQRANLQGIEGASATSMHSTGHTTGGGVRVTSIDRLGDVFLEARFRQETSSAARLGVVSQTWSLLESRIAEPGESGLAAQLDTFFTSWEDVANRPEDPAARAVLLENGRALTEQIAGGYRDVEAQWAAARSQAAAVATEVNTTAEAVADLNSRIRTVTVSGGTPNDLADQRGQLLNDLADLIGGEVRERTDGTVDVMVGGNALVRGDTANKVAITGARTLDALGAAPAVDAGPIRLTWETSSTDVGASGGQLTGMLTALAPATAQSSGGVIAEMGQRYNELAGTLADAVNGVHAGGVNLDGDPPVAVTDPAGHFFSVSRDAADGPAALNLAVALADGSKVRAAAPDSGDLDGSVAEEISQLAAVRDTWAQTVVDVGVQTSSATQRAEAAEFTRGNAEGLLLSQTGVNLDEETMQLIAGQRAYQAAARVLTTIDQTLDTLINRTGIVGR